MKHICAKCAVPVETKKDRLPPRWKRRDKETFCGDCWRGLYVLRAITMPVASPHETDWPTLRAKVAAAWQQSTSLANHVITAYCKADVIRTAGVAKMPPFKKPYLYPVAIKLMPDMDPQSVVAVLHAVEGKYTTERYAAIWLGARSLPRYKYPVPYPLHNQAWSAHWLGDKERVPIVSLRLGRERLAVRLRGGSEFRRQLADFAALVDGSGIRGELAISRKAVTESDNHNGVKEKAAGGGQTKTFRIMFKMVGWFPRKERVNGERVMTLKTAPDSFWIATVPDRDPWRLHADHVRRWVIQHERILRRLSDDTKYEKRWPKNTRLHINEYRERLCKKQHDRMHTWQHTATKLLVSFAVRQGVKIINYDDHDHSYLFGGGSWSTLKTMLKAKCNEVGITLASAEVVEKPADPLADTLTS